MICVLMRLSFVLRRLLHEICLTKDSFLLFFASTCRNCETILVNLGTSENDGQPVCSISEGSLMTRLAATKPQLSD